MRIFNKPPEKPNEDFFQMSADDIIIKEDIYPDHEGQHPLFEKFGTRTGGICDTWYRWKNWEELPEIDKWKYIALCSLYWEKQYKYWYEKKEYQEYLNHLLEHNFMEQYNYLKEQENENNS